MAPLISNALRRLQCYDMACSNYEDTGTYIDPENLVFYLVIACAACICCSVGSCYGWHRWNDCHYTARRAPKGRPDEKYASNLAPSTR